MNILLGSVRLLLFFLIAAVAMILCGIFSLFGQSAVFKVYTAVIWTVRALLNIRSTVHGRIPQVQGVLMSNHRSYIDIVLIPSRIPYVVVAKRSVKSWPLVGQVGTAIRTIFVERDSAESRRRTRDAIRERLMEGLSVLIFPEGTTHKGPGILDFKPGIFRHCAEAGFPVIPIAIEFENKDMAWIDDDTFLRHFVQAFGHWRIRVDVSIGEAIIGKDGDELRLRTQQWVADETLRLAELQRSGVSE